MAQHQTDEIIRSRRMYLITWHMLDVMIKVAHVFKKEKPPQWGQYKAYNVYTFLTDGDYKPKAFFWSKVSLSLMSAGHAGARGYALTESEIEYLQSAHEDLVDSVRFDDLGYNADPWNHGTFDDAINNLTAIQAKIADSLLAIDRWFDGESATLFMA